jgi:hypothetical protein
MLVGQVLSGGEEWEFFVVDLTNQIDFAATGGEIVISENGLKANSTGSAIVAKFVGNYRRNKYLGFSRKFTTLTI